MKQAEVSRPVTEKHTVNCQELNLCSKMGEIVALVKLDKYNYHPEDPDGKIMGEEAEFTTSPIINLSLVSCPSSHWDPHERQTVIAETSNTIYVGSSHSLLSDFCLLTRRQTAQAAWQSEREKNIARNTYNQSIETLAMKLAVAKAEIAKLEKILARKGKVK